MQRSTRIVLKRYDGKVNVLKITYGLASTPFGESFIAAVCGEYDAVCQLHFGQKDLQAGREHLNNCWPNATMCENNELAVKWTQGIFESTEKTIDILVNGTDFQIDVWNALLKIPNGETRTYAEVAEMIGKPRAIRAVANAVAKNEIAFLIPCHRVVAKDGNKLKYRWGGQIKQNIMEHEQINLI